MSDSNSINNFNHFDSRSNSNTQQTSSALLEQLVYIDNFMSNDIPSNMDIDGQLSLDLAAFADDSFIFPDEDKPKNNDQNKGNSTHNKKEDEFSIHNTNPRNNATRGKNAQSYNQHKEQHSNLENTLEALLSLNNQNSLSSQLANTSSYQHQQQHQTSPNIPNSSVLRGSNALANLPKVHVPPGAQSSLVAAGLSQTQIDVLAALIAQHQTTGSSNVNTPQSQPQPLNQSSGRTSSSINGSNIESSSANQALVNESTSSYNNDYQFPTLSNQNNIIGNYNVTLSASTSPQNIASPPQIHNGSGTDNSSNSHSRKSSTSNTNISNSDKAAELDKRRRNTAASARFRIKKKLKEQQLEKTVRDLNDQARSLEVKIQQLEMENKLLRNLVVEKGTQRDDEELELLRKKAKLDSEKNVGASF